MARLVFFNNLTGWRLVGRNDGNVGFFVVPANPRSEPITDFNPGFRVQATESRSMRWRNDMELVEAIKGRRSIRKYQDRNIPDSVVEGLLDLALYAPSSMDGQPWHFIVIREDKTKKALVEIKNRYCPLEKERYQADFIQHAPVVIIVCVDRQKSYDRGVENAVLATSIIVLGAYSEGLGSVYMSAYRANDPKISDEIRETLSIPPDMDPITIIPLGYPNEVPIPKKIKLLEEVLSYESFSGK